MEHGGKTEWDHHHLVINFPSLKQVSFIFQPHYIAIMTIAIQNTPMFQDDFLTKGFLWPSHTYTKNCAPFVSFPLLAMDSKNGWSCVLAKASSICETEIVKTNRNKISYNSELTWKGTPVNRFTTCAVTSREISRLDHEIFHNTMENNALVVEWFSSCLTIDKNC